MCWAWDNDIHDIKLILVNRELQTQRSSMIRREVGVSCFLCFLGVPEGSRESGDGGDVNLVRLQGDSINRLWFTRSF